MHLDGSTSYNQLRNAFVKEYDADREHVTATPGSVKIPGVYVLRCGPESIFTFPTEPEEDTLITSAGIEIHELRGAPSRWFDYDSVSDWAAVRKSDAASLPIEELTAVEQGEKTLYYVGRATNMVDQIWKQRKGTGSKLAEILPPRAVEIVSWGDGEDVELDVLKEEVVEQYLAARDDAVVIE